jgi:hypothetical protein
MAVLTSPIQLQNIYNRFADYVVFSANSNIAWGTNVIPFIEIPSSIFGGPVSGQPTILSGAGSAGTLINANNIYNAVLNETFRYTNLRLLRAVLVLTGTGDSPWNTPIGPRIGVPGIIFDQTRKAHLNSSFRFGVDPSFLARGSVVAGNTITSSGLEDLFFRARALYFIGEGIVHQIVVNVCHASCHSSCHNSRSRR